MSWGITFAVMVVTSVAVAINIAWPLLVGRSEASVEGEEGEGAQMLDELLVQKDAAYSAIKELEFDHAMGNLSKKDYQELAHRYEDKAVALLKTIDQVSEGSPIGGIAPPAVAGVMLGAPHATPTEDPVERQVAALRRTGGKGGGKGRGAGGAGGHVGDEIERDVARLRAGRQPANGRKGSTSSDIEQQVAALRAARRGSASPHPASTASPDSSISASCPSCGALLKSASVAFCSHCGAALATTCPVCDAPAEPGDAFCSSCGTSLAARTTVGTGQTVLGGANA